MYCNAALIARRVQIHRYTGDSRRQQSNYHLK